MRRTSAARSSHAKGIHLKHRTVGSKSQQEVLPAHCVKATTKICLANQIRETSLRFILAATGVLSFEKDLLRTRRHFLFEIFVIYEHDASPFKVYRVSHLPQEQPSDKEGAASRGVGGGRGMEGVDAYG